MSYIYTKIIMPSLKLNKRKFYVPKQLFAQLACCRFVLSLIMHIFKILFSFSVSCFFFSQSSPVVQSYIFQLGKGPDKLCVSAFVAFPIKSNSCSLEAFGDPDFVLFNEAYNAITSCYTRTIPLVLTSYFYLVCNNALPPTFLCISLD